MLKDIVLELDGNAFVSIIEVSEIMGKTKMYGKKNKQAPPQEVMQMMIDGNVDGFNNENE